MIVVFFNWRIKDKLFEIRYDWRNDNKAVTSKDEINSILSGFKEIDYEELDEKYLHYTKSNEKKYRRLLRGLKYFEINREDFNKRIVGKFRVKEFICKDDFYKKCIFNKSSKYHCLFNPKIFYKTLELIIELENKGHDKYGFRIVNGHRHPGYNEKIGGAKLSKHLKGEAVDIVVDDVNKDGVANKADKDIILHLLEHKIIKNEGGIGLYPGTDNVHYDVRGTRARWDSY